MSVPHTHGQPRVDVPHCVLGSEASHPEGARTVTVPLPEARGPRKCAVCPRLPWGCGTTRKCSTTSSLQPSHGAEGLLCAGLCDIGKAAPVCPQKPLTLSTERAVCRGTRQSRLRNGRRAGPRCGSPGPFPKGSRGCRSGGCCPPWRYRGPGSPSLPCPAGGAAGGRPWPQPLFSGPRSPQRPRGESRHVHSLSPEPGKFQAPHPLPQPLLLAVWLRFPWRRLSPGESCEEDHRGQRPPK